MRKTKTIDINQTNICKNCNILFSAVSSKFSDFCCQHCARSYAGKHVKNRKNTFADGHTPWNSGQTKETNESIRKGCENLKLKYKTGELIPSFLGKTHTKETKERLSELQKAYLKNNPDNHPWRKNTKFKSEPCERLKQKLKEQNLDFNEEFNDISWEHNYSIDVAFPSSKIGIEVNGNQHYNNDGTLTDYYQKREDYLKSLGWTIYQVHYSLVYSDEFLFDFITKIKLSIA